MTPVDTLSFVLAGVSQNEFQPTLQHYLLEPGRVTASNGNLCVSAPYPIDLHCAPLAEKFTDAVTTCAKSREPTTYTLEGDRLTVASGRFSSIIPCCDVARFPEMPKGGVPHPVEVDILPALKSLLPFISNDEGKPWARNVLFRGKSAYATNNVMIVEHWLGFPMPQDAVIPVECIKALVKKKEAPYQVAFEPSGETLSFYFPGDISLTARTYARDWPAVEKIVTAGFDAFQGSYLTGGVLETLFDDVKDLAKFGEAVTFSPGELAIDDAHRTAFQASDYPQGGKYYTVHLALLRKVAKHVGFSAYPQAVPFYNEQMRGVMMGLRI